MKFGGEDINQDRDDKNNPGVASDSTVADIERKIVNELRKSGGSEVKVVVLRRLNEPGHRFYKGVARLKEKMRIREKTPVKPGGNHVLVLTTPQEANNGEE